MQLFSHGYVFLNGKCCVLFVHTVLGGFTPKKTVEEELTKTSTRVHAPGEDQYLEGLMSADPHWPGKRVDVARRQARGTVENHGEHAAYVSGTLIYIYIAGDQELRVSRYPANLNWIHRTRSGHQDLYQV